MFYRTMLLPLAVKLYNLFRVLRKPIKASRSISRKLYKAMNIEVVSKPSIRFKIKAEASFNPQAY